MERHESVDKVFIEATVACVATPKGAIPLVAGRLRCGAAAKGGQPLIASSAKNLDVMFLREPI
jgi:hypothetical protein